MHTTGEKKFTGKRDQVKLKKGDEVKAKKSCGNFAAIIKKIQINIKEHSG